VAKMNSGFKILYWVGITAAFLLLLLCALAFIIPKFVDSTWLKEKIRTEVSSQVKGEFDFQRVELNILPTPSVALKQVSLSIPATASIKLETLKIYPDILPLLLGKIKLDNIVIDAPDFSLPLPQKSSDRPNAATFSDPFAFLETVSSSFPTILEEISDLDIGIKHGTMQLFSGDSQFILVENLNCEFKIKDQSLSAAISSFTALHENGKTIAKLEKLQGNMQYSKQITKVTVEDFSLSYPQVQLSGAYVHDQKAQHASLDLSFQEINIAEIGKMLPLINTFYGELPEVRKISDIIRGGTIFQAHFHVEGESPTDLAVFKSMQIQAQVKDGSFQLSEFGLDLKDVAGEITLDHGVLEGRNLQARMGKSRGSAGSFRLSLPAEETTPFHLDLNLNADLADLYEVLKHPMFEEQVKEHLSYFKSIEGTGRGRLILDGSLELPSLLVEVENISARIKFSMLPDIVMINSSRAKVAPNEITFERLQVDLLDGSFTSSGSLENFINLPIKARIKLEKSEIGPRFNSWFAQEMKTPKEYMLRTPLLISQANINWTQAEILELQGDFSIKNGPVFAIDIMHNTEGVILRKLAVTNSNDQAAIKLDLQKKTIGGEFHGELSKQSIDAVLLQNEIFPDAWVKGDIRFFIDQDTLANSSAEGSLEGGSFILPWKRDQYFLLNGFSLSASERTVRLNSAQLRFGEDDYEVNGETFLTQKGLTFDLNVMADTIELDKILAASEQKSEPETSEPEVIESRDFSVDGNIRLQANSLHFKNYNWEPFKSDITFDDGSLAIKVLEAELCRISTPGVLTLQDGEITLDFKLAAIEQESREVLVCLEGGEQQMTGIMRLDATIKGQGSRDTLLNSLEGDLQYSSKDGYIYKDAKMAKLLYVLNITNLFRGKIPDLATTGFYYDSIMVNGSMEKGILTITPAKLDATIMEISAYGTIDIPEESVDIQVLVAPLQTINKLQKMLPVISMILPGSLIAVPIEVKGDFSDIKVRTMSMSAISKSIFGTMVNVLSTPVRMLEGASTE